MKASFLVLVIIWLLIPVRASAGHVYEVSKQTVACPDSMKSMRYARTGTVKRDIGCLRFSPGERLSSEESVKPDLNPKSLLKLTNGRKGNLAFTGYFIGRDLVYIGEY